MNCRIVCRWSTLQCQWCTLQWRADTSCRQVLVAGHFFSPLSTGGAGVIFEYDVAAILMSRLLRGGSVPVGIHEPVARVAFQQGNEGCPLDDVVAYAQADPPAIAPSIQIQVKRRVKVTGGDAEFIKVMAAA